MSDVLYPSVRLHRLSSVFLKQFLTFLVFGIPNIRLLQVPSYLSIKEPNRRFVRYVFTHSCRPQITWRERVLRSTFLFTVHYALLQQPNIEEVNGDTNNNYRHDACNRGKNEIVMESLKNTNVQLTAKDNCSLTYRV